MCGRNKTEQNFEKTTNNFEKKTEINNSETKFREQNRNINSELQSSLTLGQQKQNENFGNFLEKFEKMQVILLS